MGAPANRPPSGSKNQGGATKYKKGQSGNPKGRPKGDPELRLACRNMTSIILLKLRDEIMEDGKDWLEASKVVLAYGWGKPAAAPEDHEALASATSGLAVLSTAEIVKAVRVLNEAKEDE